jgi:diaminohydroxyphosphoribosylaminopyrimidine deaminase / 5-amino-6-(5-phosphoribosylamino)uracil reductase
MKASDRLFLQATIELAERGRFTCSPNPTVGCLIVRDGAIIGRGYHAWTGQGHAEVNAIADAGGDVAGATVFVSLEPCAFVGRTPACAQTLIDAAVARVVIAAEDPHLSVSGHGIKMMRRAGLEVSLLTQQAALNLIQGYVSRISRGLPFVRIKTASSIDGGIALASGESQWITGPEARSDVQYWRARSDAIITGIGTVLADDPQLTVRDATLAPYRQPLRVVLDSRLRTPANARILSDGAATLLVHNPDTPVPEHLREVEHVTLFAPDGGTEDLQHLLRYLAEAGCNEVLVEGGGGVCGSFARSALWDEWLCYIAPKWLGTNNRNLAEFTVPGLAAAPTGRVVEINQVGADMRVRIMSQATDEQ